MNNMQSFLSIDIETTGLQDINPYVLQIGMSFHDWGVLPPLQKIPDVMIYIDNGPLDPNRCGEFAMNLNKSILKKIDDLRLIQKDMNVPDFLRSLKTVKEANEFIANHLWLINQAIESHWGPEMAKKKILPAGKNFAGFDLPILLSNGFDSFKGKLSHRTMDPGSLYYSHFGYVPSLDEINKLIGRASVTHDALDDAYDVIEAVKAAVTGEAFKENNSIVWRKNAG